MKYVVQIIAAGETALRRNALPLQVGVVTAALLLITLSVNLEVPLYGAYAQAAGYGSGPTAVMFAAYVAGLLPVLFLLGGISDWIGRKKAMVLGLLVALTATGSVIVSPSMKALFVARILQGIGVGLSLGAGTAYLSEILDAPARAASYAGIAITVGLGSGPLVTSGSLLYKYSLVPVSYYGVVLSTVLCMVCMIFLPSVKGNRADRLIRLPHISASTLKYCVAIFLAWSMTGIIIAVVPGELARQQLTEWTGLLVFLAICSGACFQPWGRRLGPQRSLTVGYVLLALAYALLLCGIGLERLSLILVGSAFAGATCFGFIYLGGLAAVIQASGQKKARAVSGYFLFAYLGLGLPCILTGFLADRFGVFYALAGSGFVMLMAFILIFTAIRAWFVSSSKTEAVRGPEWRTR